MKSKLKSRLSKDKLKVGIAAIVSVLILAIILTLVYVQVNRLVSPDDTEAGTRNLAKIAAETTHFNAQMGGRNVNGVYEASTKHFIPAVFHNYAVNGRNFINNISIIDVSGTRDNKATVTYYRVNTDTKVAERMLDIPALGFVNIGSFINGLLPNNFMGSVVITTTKLSIVENTTADNNNHARGTSSFIPSQGGTTLYMPIVYDQVFRRYNSVINIQNIGNDTIPANGLSIDVLCQNGITKYPISNANPIPPFGSTFINLAVPASFGAGDFCPNSAVLFSKMFGHGYLKSPQPVVGIMTIVNSDTLAQRETKLSNKLSKKIYAPGIYVGSYKGKTFGSSLNISNPTRGVVMHSDVSVYAKNNQGKFELFETRKPQGPGPNAYAPLEEPIPATGEKSFLFKSKPGVNPPGLGVDKAAIGFTIIKSDYPQVVSVNKTNSTDDIAELGLRDEEIKESVFIPQFFYSFAGHNSVTQIVNTSETVSGTYRMQVFSNTGARVKDVVFGIDPLNAFIIDTDYFASLNIPNNSAYFIRIFKI